ncbi:MAG: hypothetical protein MJZ11_11850 [Lachnospiraceae bacterium]|nr:hypothetical protein [Lachnospiraceae bacterium]
MKKIRLLLITIATVVLSLGFSISAMAAPKVMPDGNVFDAELYAVLYPDVVAAVGTDEAALYYHYAAFGKKEGRIAAMPGVTAESLKAPKKEKWQYTEAELIDQVIAACITPGMNPLDMARAVNKYLCDNTTYDNTATRYSTFDTLAYGTAICQGYANAFWKIMNKLGVPTDYVSGYANGGRHAWNRCNFGGVYLYTDVTWNDSLHTDKYLLITAEQMERDHQTMEINRKNRVM